MVALTSRTGLLESNMFVLLLTFFSTYTQGTTHSAVQIGNFNSYATCAKAGEIIKKQHGNEDMVEVNWSCVRIK